jgi:drug/metabolite transporter (DMT)-like permease
VLYLALAASVLCFSLYFPVVRKIGPAKAAYSSVLVPIIAMTLSTASKAIAGACWRRRARCWRSAGCCSP